MLTQSKNLKPGDRVRLPAFECDHVIVIGPEWEPKEVWLSDQAGHVVTLDPHVKVEIVEPGES